MWRRTLQARKALLTSSSSKFNGLSHHQQPQVLLNSCNQNRPSSESASHFTTWVSKNPAFFHNLRHFSSDPSGESNVGSSPSLSEGSLGSDFDSGLSFDENPAVVSSEFDENASIFDENGDKLGVYDGENLVMGGESETLLGENETLVSENEEKKVEIDAETFENLLSLLQSSSDGDVSVENSLNEMGLVVSKEIVLRVLETSHVPGENLIAFYSWCLKKSKFSATSQTLDALVNSACSELKVSNGYAVWDLLKEVGEKEKGLLSTVTLNKLISLYSRSGKGKAAFEVFNKFEEFGCVADSDTYYYTIEALCRRSLSDWASLVSQKMVSGEVLPDAEKVGKIIAYLCKRRKARDAHSVYLLAKEKKKYPPRDTVISLISSLCYLPKKDKASVRDEVDKICHENIYLAANMLEDLSAEDRKCATKPFSSVIEALCKIGDVEKAKELLFKMIASGPPPGNGIFNWIINGFSKAGDMEEATNLLKVIEDRGLKPDVYSYSVIMSGYVKKGAVEEARKLLDEAKKKHAKLSPVTYHTLIRGYCKLDQFDEAVKLITEMEDYGVRPSADEYNKLIQSLCLKSLDWEMAEKLLEEMKTKGLFLNGITKGLIKAVKELEEEEKGIEEVAVAE